MDQQSQASGGYGQKAHASIADDVDALIMALNQHAQSGPFSRANNIKLSDEVPSLNLIVNTGAQSSFVPSTFPLDTRTHDPTDIIYPGGGKVKTTEAGVLDSDICFKVPGLTSGLLSPSAMADSLVTIFDNQLSIFQPNEQIAHAFKTFVLNNSSKLFTTSRRDSDNMFRLPLAIFQPDNEAMKCCLTRYILHYTP